MFIHGDLLHIFHLGTGRDLVGSALVMMLRGPGIFPGTNIPDRLSSATASLRSYARDHQLPLKLHKLSRSKLNWTGSNMPELRSSGYDTFVVNRWLTDVSLRFEGQLPPELCRALWTADHLLSIVANAGRWLTEPEQRNKEQFGNVFVRSYMELATASLRNRDRLFRFRPKFHILHHLLKDSPRSRLNPNVYSTWMDEDALRKIMKVHRITSIKTAPKRILQRYLLGLPGIWKRKAGR